jgi:ribulose kinase
VIVPAITEAASWGAAVLAGIGAGVFADVAEASRATAARSQRLAPGQPEAHRPLYECYRRRWPALCDTAAQIAP